MKHLPREALFAIAPQGAQTTPPSKLTSNRMKTIKIQYFAKLREERGLEEEQYTTDATDAAALYQELRQQHGFSVPTDVLCVAVNGAFAGWETPIAAGDLVVFLPPVAGG